MSELESVTLTMLEIRIIAQALLVLDEYNQYEPDDGDHADGPLELRDLRAEFAALVALQEVPEDE